MNAMNNIAVEGRVEYSREGYSLRNPHLVTPISGLINSGVKSLLLAIIVRQVTHTGMLVVKRRYHLNFGW